MSYNRFSLDLLNTDKLMGYENNRKNMINTIKMIVSFKQHRLYSDPKRTGCDLRMDQVCQQFKSTNTTNQFKDN